MYGFRIRLCVGMGCFRRDEFCERIQRRESVHRQHFEMEHRVGNIYEIYVFFRFCVQPRHWGLEHRESDYYVWYVLLGFCVQPQHFLVDRIRSDNGANEYVSRRFCVSSEIRVHRRRHRSGEFVQYNQEHLGRASPSSFSASFSAFSSSSAASSNSNTIGELVRFR